MTVKKILVSQPQPSTDKSPYHLLAEKHNTEVVFRPFIKVEGLSAKEFRQQRINLAEFTAVIFTSRTAVDHFFHLCEEMRITIPATMKYFCLSEPIANYIQKYTIFRKRKIFFSKTGKFADLMPAILKHSSDNYLLVASDVNKGDDASVLQANNIKFTQGVLYRTVSNDFTPEEAFDYDMLVFFSPQGIESLLKNFPDFQQGDIKIAAFGASTAKAVTDAGLRVDVQAPTVQAPSMPAAIDLFLSQD